MSDHSPFAPWVLSSTVKLIRYLHSSYFFPCRSSDIFLFCFSPPSLSFCRSARVFTERSLLHIMSRHAPYCWLATSFVLGLSSYPTFNRYLADVRMLSGSRQMLSRRRTLISPPLDSPWLMVFSASYTSSASVNRCLLLILSLFMKPITANSLSERHYIGQENDCVKIQALYSG